MSKGYSLAYAYEDPDDRRRRFIPKAGEVCLAYAPPDTRLTFGHRRPGFASMAFDNNPNIFFRAATAAANIAIFDLKMAYGLHSSALYLPRGVGVKAATATLEEILANITEEFGSVSTDG